MRLVELSGTAKGKALITTGKTKGQIFALTW